MVETELSLKSYLLEQLEREAALSRKAIERVPEGQNSFKPHEKSMELGMLAALVATMVGWIAVMIETQELDFGTPEAEKFRTRPLETKAALQSALESALVKARRALTYTTEVHLQTQWAFKMGGKVVHQGERWRMIADSVFSHLAHHRGQLTVYLRLAEAKVPALYGPSADEQV